MNINGKIREGAVLFCKVCDCCLNCMERVRERERLKWCRGVGVSSSHCIEWEIYIESTNAKEKAGKIA